MRIPKLTQAFRLFLCFYLILVYHNILNIKETVFQKGKLEQYITKIMLKKMSLNVMNMYLSLQHFLFKYVHIPNIYFPPHFYAYTYSVRKHEEVMYKTAEGKQHK